MRKYTIYNKKARKELEDAYNIRKLMHDSFRKTASETKSDFTKDIIKHVSEDDKNLEFNPLISVGFAFVLSILLISAVIIYVLSM